MKDKTATELQIMYYAIYDRCASVPTDSLRFAVYKSVLKKLNIKLQSIYLSPPKN